MKLHVLRAKQPANLAVMERVLSEFEAIKTIELFHDTGADFLSWSDATDDMRHTISISIPGAWLDDSRNAPQLEATTRKFAGYVSAFSFPPR